jgi:hypothetical protein
MNGARADERRLRADRQTSRMWASSSTMVVHPKKERTMSESKRSNSEYHHGVVAAPLAIRNSPRYTAPPAEPTVEQTLETLRAKLLWQECAAQGNDPYNTVGVRLARSY